MDEEGGTLLDSNKSIAKLVPEDSRKDMTSKRGNCQGENGVWCRGGIRIECSPTRRTGSAQAVMVRAGRCCNSVS
jgi:hypothetical protein